MKPQPSNIRYKTESSIGAIMLSLRRDHTPLQEEQGFSSTFESDNLVELLGAFEQSGTSINFRPALESTFDCPLFRYFTASSGKYKGAAEIVERLVGPETVTRMTVNEALEHPFQKRVKEDRSQVSEAHRQ
ncbi:hypothetical protein BG015_003386 [Linnemannia schmuckeri]|uniref:Uncharacterized protein n=1 Tax=Linnemannia schmuckeri TaxID=64567 RepID=A0A9P5RKT7_9FUNG|nr:hypothetical protein BG015_003386 [Linnemannia schmuckeri]